MRRIFARLGLIGTLTVAATGLSSQAYAAGTISVNTTADNDINDGLCTLREAIIAINNNNSYHGCTNLTTADTISLPVGTITLTSSPPVSSGSGHRIVGQGYGQTVINGPSGGAAGFRVSSSGLSFLDLTLQNFGTSALVIDAGASGSISYVKIARSGGATTSGGCILNNGSATITRSQLELCNAFSGGAVRNNASGSMTIDASTVLKCTGEHGVIYNEGTLDIRTSTIGANSTGVAAGIYNFGGSVSVFSSTLAYNKATLSTGVRHLFNDPNGGGSMFVGNTVVSSWGDNSSNPDCSGTITSDGNNAYTSGKGCNFNFDGDRTISDPLLQRNTMSEDGFTNTPMAGGGVGRLYLPAINSPLVGQVTGNGLFADQRGVKRKALNDIGAVQRSDALLVVGNTTLSIGDQQIQSTLSFLGFGVTIRSDVAASSSDAVGKALVVVSESVTSSNVNTKFRDTSTGVLVLEPAILDDMNMTTTTNFGTVNTSQVNLVRPNASQFNFFASAIGAYGVFTTTGSSVSHGWGIPTSAALPGADNVTTPTRKHAFYYARAAIMANGFEAPGRRVSLGLTNAATPTLTALGQRLLDESILLASGPIAF